MPLLISIFMLAVATFSFLRRDAGIVPAPSTSSRTAELSGYAATFLLGIYGGFFSGGYVTMLTPIFVVCFSMTFVQAVANTKLVNIFGARIALKLDNLWLRRIFLATVVALALKTLIYDFVWQQLL